MRDRSTDILHVVPQDTPVTVREIMDMLGVEPGHTYRVVNTLTAQGFLTQKVSPIDGISRFRLTPRGEAMYLSRTRFRL